MHNPEARLMLAVDEQSAMPFGPVMSTSPDMLGMGAWDFCPPLQGGWGKDDGAMVYQTNTSRAELADQALTEWARFFLRR